ncbi:MAG: hypothetical protein AB1521_04440 [Bacteroidota bacterium]
MNCLQEIPLKQHTPIIQYQYNQEGATLRASDIKPRLDKYLNETILNKYYESAVLTSGIKGVISEQAGRMKNKRSSLYQIDIESSDKNELEIKREGRGDRSLYFGDIKKMLLYKQNKIIVKSFYPELIEAIKLTLPIMFMFENFGTRQNKGYGSYTVDGQEIEKILKKCEADSVYYFDISKNKEDDNEIFYRLFKGIYYFYNTIKGGVNEDFNKREKDKYSKSLLFKYLKNKNPDLIWEKRLLKLELGNNKDFDSVKNNNDTMLIRHVLGLSDTYSFTQKKNVRMDTEDYSPRNGKTVENDMINIDKGFQFKLKNDDYDRIPSPIFIKPIKQANEFRVYIILKPDQINNISFKISKEYKLGTKPIPIGNFNRSGSYSLKCINDFNLIDFFENDVCKKFNSQTRSSFINKFVKDIKLEKLV